MIQVLAVLAVFGMACLIWLAYGWLLIPAVCPVRAVILADGAGDGLERTVKTLQFLRRSGLWRGEITIQDCGLTREGLAIAMALSREDGVEFSGRRAE